MLGLQDPVLRALLLSVYPCGLGCPLAATDQLSISDCKVSQIKPLFSSLIPALPPAFPMSVNGNPFSPLSQKTVASSSLPPQLDWSTIQFNEFTHFKCSWANVSNWVQSWVQWLQCTMTIKIQNCSKDLKSSRVLFGWIHFPTHPLQATTDFLSVTAVGLILEFHINRIIII